MRPVALISAVLAAHRDMKNEPYALATLVVSALAEHGYTFTEPSE